MDPNVKVDVVYERQWRPLPYPVYALQKLGLMGTFYGGFPKFRYVRGGTPESITRTFPGASLFNHAAARLRLPSAVRLDEPRWLGLRVARQKNLSRVIMANGTVHRFLAPRLGRDHVIVLERGSMFPEDFYLRPQIARKEAGYSCELRLPASIEDEIEKTKQVHFVICASNYVRDSYLRRGYREDRVFDGSFGIDPAAFPFVPRAAPENRPIRIGIVGVIGFRKGLYRILKIGDWAKKQRLPLELHFAGPIQDPEAQEMLGKTRAEFRLHGVVKGAALQEMLARCDMYALPSYEEGLPFSVLESMSSGLPAIVSADTGACEVVQHGVTGVVLNEFSEAEFEKELGPIFRAPKRIIQMGAAARIRIEGAFTFEHYCQRLAAAFDTIVKSAGQNPAELGCAWRQREPYGSVCSESPSVVPPKGTRSLFPP